MLKPDAVLRVSAARRNTPSDIARAMEVTLKNRRDVQRGSVRVPCTATIEPEVAGRIDLHNIRRELLFLGRDGPIVVRGAIGAPASSSKRHLGLCCRGGEILSLRAARRHRRQRGTPRTRSGRRPQPLSGSPALDELPRQETESGIARNQASPRLSACVPPVCAAAERPHAPGMRRLRDLPRGQRAPPSGCCRRPCEPRRRPPTWRGLAFSLSRPNCPSVAFGAAATGQGQGRRRGRR